MYEHILVLMVASLNMSRMGPISSVLAVSGGTCRLLNSCRPLGTQWVQFLKTRPQWGAEMESEKIVLIFLLEKSAPYHVEIWYQFHKKMNFTVGEPSDIAYFIFH